MAPNPTRLRTGFGKPPCHKAVTCKPAVTLHGPQGAGIQPIRVPSYFAYDFIGFGAMECHFAYDFIGFGVMDGCLSLCIHSF